MLAVLAQLASPARRPALLYALFGCIAAGSDLLIFTILVEAELLPVRPANILSVSCGILISFVLNRAFTFKVRDRVLRRLAGFFAVGLLGLALSDLVIGALTGWADLWPPLAKLLSIPLVFLLQYNVNRLVTFRASDP